MKPPRVDIGRIRREQIVDAAVAVIAERGLQRLSLSEIEKRVGMARGHLMYYYPAKEDILLAVFDRLLKLMYERHGATSGRDFDRVPPTSVEEIIRVLLPSVMQGAETNAEFHALQYTFMSQISHRDDFRRRLASLYDEWRCRLAQRLADDLHEGKSARNVPPRTMASLIQAILHGVAMQLAADPEAFDRQEMLTLCSDLVGSYLSARLPGTATRGKKTNEDAPLANGSQSKRRRKRRRQGVHHE